MTNSTSVGTALVTGTAGFIGSEVSHVLLDRGIRVIGVDNINDYYDRTLKTDRLARLQKRDGFEFTRIDIPTIRA